MMKHTLAMLSNQIIPSRAHTYFSDLAPSIQHGERIEKGRKSLEIILHAHRMINQCLLLSWIVHARNTQYNLENLFLPQNFNLPQQTWKAKMTIVRYSSLKGVLY